MHVERAFGKSGLLGVLPEAVVDFWWENLRRFAENQPLLGVVDRRAGY